MLQPAPAVLLPVLGLSLLGAPLVSAEDVPVPKPEAPRVTLRGATDGAKVRRPLTLEATSSLPAQGMAFFVNNRVVLLTTVAPYRFVLDPARFLKGAPERTVQVHAAAVLDGKLVPSQKTAIVLAAPDD